MAEIITVSGSPGSGKTSFSVKLAQEIYLTKRGIGKEGRVIVYSPDTEIPSLAYLFPRNKESDLYSVGEALDKTHLTPEDVLRQLVTVDGMKNLGYLGYKYGEDSYTYATPTAEKTEDFFFLLTEIADCVIVDCTCRSEGCGDFVAKHHATHWIQIVNPDLKSIVYFGSNPILEEGVIKVLNITERELYLPILETQSYFGEFDGIIPYSCELKKQSIKGELFAPVSDSKYRKALSGVLNRIFMPPPEESRKEKKE